MAQTNSSELVKNLQKASKVQTMSGLPTTLSNQIAPTIEINPNLVKDIDLTYVGTATNATSATILTTPSNRDFFLLGSILTVNKDASSTSTASTITCVVNGLTLQVNRINFNTTSAQNTTTAVVMLPRRIKVDRGTAINVTNGTNVANVTSSGLIFGYYDDDNG